MMKNISKEYWFVVGTALLSGFIVFSGQIFKDLGLSLLEMSVLIYLPVLLFLFPSAMKKRSEIFDFSNFKRLLAWSLVAVFVVICQFGAIIAGAPVAIVALLLYTQPVWTLLISRIFLGAKICKLDIWALISVLLGMVILISPWDIGGIGNIYGVIIALCGGLALSGWIIFGSIVGKSKMDPYVAKFMEALLQSILIPIVLSALIILLQVPDNIMIFRLDWPATTWILIILFAIFTQVIAHVLYLKGTRVVPAKEAGILMLLEPVSAALLAYLFLSQPITLNIVLGGAFILFANYLVLTKKHV